MIASCSLRIRNCTVRPSSADGRSLPSLPATLSPLWCRGLRYSSREKQDDRYEKLHDVECSCEVECCFADAYPVW